MRYATDGLGRITTISEVTGGANVASYSYDVASRIKNITFGNGSVQTFTHDDVKGWLDSVSLDPEGANDNAAEVTDKDVTFTYKRDSLGRIESEEISNAAYVWRPAQIAVNGTTLYTANEDNQYTAVGEVGPAYDAAGNLTGDGTFEYAYDSQNMLKTVKKTVDMVTMTVASYSYDALGRRSQKHVTAGNVTTKYLWGGAVNYAEMDGAGVVQRYFIYGGGIDTPVMVREYNGSKTYVHQSGKSSVFATTSTAGLNAATGTTAYNMDPWGQGTDASGSPFKFTARRIDDETGNYYYRNRYYHAGQGRYMSNDPIGYGDGLNMYAYVKNDPVNKHDPMGLTEVIPVTDKHRPKWDSSTDPAVIRAILDQLKADVAADIGRGLGETRDGFGATTKRNMEACAGNVGIVPPGTSPVNPGSIDAATGFTPGGAGDKLNLLTSPGFTRSLRAIAAARKATVEADALFFPDSSDRNPLGNAVRHAYWNALMALSIGPAGAQRFSNAHENSDSSAQHGTANSITNAGASYKDLINNRNGIALQQANPSATATELLKIIINAAHSGGLQIENVLLDLNAGNIILCSP